MSRQPIASRIEIERELRAVDSYPAPLPENPTPKQEADAWAEDARTVYDAASRAESRRRGELVAWHEQRLAELRRAAA